MSGYLICLERLAVQVRLSRTCIVLLYPIFSGQYVLIPGDVIFLDPGRDKIVAPITRYENAKELGEPTAILVSLDEMQDLFSRHVTTKCSKSILTSQGLGFPC